MRPLTRTLVWLIPVALLLGCPGTEGDDDDTAPEPDGCTSMGLTNLQYDFLMTDPEGLFGYDGTDEQWWTDLAREYADDPEEPNVLFLGLELLVGSHDPDGSMQKLALEWQYGGETLLWVDFWYSLPGGRTIPAAVGDTIQWYYVWNFASVDHPATAPMILDAEGRLLFYGEPGANGLAYSNDPMYPDETANPLFAHVIPNDHGCTANLDISCGEQFNLQLEFITYDDQVIELWPGEASTFTIAYDDGSTAELELTNVWSYDWRDTSCSGAQYERNYAFFVLLAS